MVVNDPVVFARWHLGEIGWGAALRCGAIEVSGSRDARPAPFRPGTATTNEARNRCTATNPAETGRPGVVAHLTDN